MGIIAGYRLNMKSLMTNKAMLALFVCCQIIGFIALLVSLSYILHMDVMYEDNIYKMDLGGNITYGECADKLSEIPFKQATLYLDEGKTLAVTLGEETGVSKGRALNQDEYEALVSRSMEGAEIGLEIEVFGNTYKVVGLVTLKNYVELTRKALDESLTVYAMDIDNPLIGEKKVENYANTLEELFGCEVVAPVYLSFSDKIVREPYYAVIGVGILGISAVTMVLCYRYMFVKRSYDYMVERCIGADRSHLFIAMLLEVLTVVGATMLIASLIYLILERTLFAKIFVYLFGVANSLSIGYYLLIFALFAIMCILSALPSIVRLMSRKVVR